jgi:glutamate-5-semialdehyde dehydrogenase
MATNIDPSIVEQVADLARRSRVASRQLAQMSRSSKDEALLVLADALEEATPLILQANDEELQRGRDTGMSESLLDRLMLDARRIADIAQGMRDIAGLPDPVGEVVRGSTLANGLQVRQIRVPMGVVGMIYESRPNVTVDAAALCLKSGNAVLLRGGSAAGSSNRVIVDTLRDSLADQGVSADAIILLDEGGRDAARALMTARGLVDLVIPRGGADLIQTVVSESTVPVIETGIGVNHVYVDRAADLDTALSVVLNSKTHRPSVCNAAESLLVHESVAGVFLPKVLAELGAAGVLFHIAPAVVEHAEAAGAAYSLASDSDFGTEWHSLEMSVRTVPDLNAALEHIATFGTQHTEVIVTHDRVAARRFTAEVDAAVVMVNASSRFTDGGEFGFGAEIGISTQKLHARGPMALPELTTTKWVVEGDGQIRA